MGSPHTHQIASKYICDFKQNHLLSYHICLTSKNHIILILKIFHYLYAKKYVRKFPDTVPKFPQTGRIILTKLMSRLCSMKEIPNLLLTTYFMLLLIYLLNGYDAISPSLCKTLLRPKIGYDLKITCTTLEVNEILSDQDPINK